MGFLPQDFLPAGGPGLVTVASPGGSAWATGKPWGARQPLPPLFLTSLKRLRWAVVHHQNGATRNSGAASESILLPPEITRSCSQIVVNQTEGENI